MIVRAELVDVDTSELSFSVTLPPKLPTSIIAKHLESQLNLLESFQQNDERAKVKEALFVTLGALYEKYIDTEKAPLQINIDGKQRQSFHEAFNNDSNRFKHNKVLRLFESAAEDIAFLINGSVSRYRLYAEQHPQIQLITK